MNTEKSRNEIDWCYYLFSLLSILWMVVQYLAVNMRREHTDFNIIFFQNWYIDLLQLGS